MNQMASIGDESSDPSTLVQIGVLVSVAMAGI